jgi:uncharacterized membrane protein
MRDAEHRGAIAGPTGDFPAILRAMETGLTFAEVMERVAQGFEGLGALILVIGFLWSTWLAAVAAQRAGSGQVGVATLRQSFGAALLLALEVLVAADLIRTVAVAPTLENVATLGIIVLIRTILSFSLDIEIEGVAPWRRAMVSGPARVAEAARRPPAATGGTTSEPR